MLDLLTFETNKKVLMKAENFLSNLVDKSEIWEETGLKVTNIKGEEEALVYNIHVLWHSDLIL